MLLHKKQEFMGPGSSCCVCVDWSWFLAAGDFQSKLNVIHQNRLLPLLSVVENTTKKDGKKHVILHHHSEDLLVYLDSLSVPNVLPEKASPGRRSA